MIEFQWDEEKNRSNRTKHGVWFEEAEQVFDDPEALMFFDEHANNEDRFILLGHSASRILVVVFCERNQGSSIRII